MNKNKLPDDDPDWSRLPHDPVAFFELSTEFDRKDLKRSYNRLLRLYKPEKHPAEFQQIRAAYEDLERRLRYGDSRAETIEANWASADTHHASPDPRPAGSEAATTLEATDLGVLASRLEAGGESLPDAYDALVKKGQKTPPDYYALALLGDAVGPAEEQLLLRWLLQGLRAWPGDAALSQLVYGYLRTQAPIDAIPSLLVTISKAVPNDGFYRLTEGAWERLLRERPFAVFAKTLERCEANVAQGAAGDPTIGGRVTFYLFALRHALWKDSSDWKDRALEFVEENFDQAPQHLVNDLDGLMILREYLAHRSEFLAAHPLRAQFDSVLEAAYTRDQIEVDRMMADCQREVLDSPEAVAAAFPATESAACQAFYPLWAWLSDDTASRLAPPSEEVKDFRLWKGRIIGLLTESKNKASWHSTFWSLAQIVRNLITIPVVILGALLAFFPVLLLIPMVVEFFNRKLLDDAFAYSGLIAIACAIASGIWIWKWFPRALDRRVWNPFCRWMAGRCYHRIWRPRAFDFMQRSVLDFFAFRELVAQAAAEAPPDERTWMSHFIQQDFGLAVYSIAQRYQE